MLLLSPKRIPGYVPPVLLDFIAPADGKTRLDFWERENSQGFTRNEPTRHNPVLENPIPGLQSQDSTSPPAPTQFLPQADFGKQFGLSEPWEFPAHPCHGSWTAPGASLPLLFPRSPRCVPGEGDSTFVTIIHLIEFQLAGTGDGSSGCIKKEGGACCHLCHQNQFPRLCLQGMFWRFP